MFPWGPAKVPQSRSSDRPDSSQVIDLMVEREVLEPAESLSPISNLLIPLELLSPALPLHPRIWHSIWHWADAAPLRCSCNRRVETGPELTD
jgi:hypothetical protein